MSNSLLPPSAIFKKILKLALPIVAMQFSQMAMGVVDTIMSGHASLNDMAAVAIGTSIWLPLFLLMAGILTAVTPIISHLFGSKQIDKIGHVIRQSSLIAIVIALIASLILNHIDIILAIMQVNQETQPIILDYLNAISWGTLGIAFFFILRFLNEGMANTIPVMLIGFFGLLANVLFNYVLIFGHWGFPALGGVGAGWATTITHWLMALALLIYIYHAKIFKHIQLFVVDFKIDSDELKTLFKLGFPIGIAYFVEGSIFSVIALFIASLGTIVVASHQIALNVSSLVFMIPLSLSIAITILVGHAKGANNIVQLKQIAHAGYLISLVQAVIIALLILNYAESITDLYTKQQEVIGLASSLMIFAAIYQLPDAIQLLGSATLRGLKDTAIPMVFSIISFWLIGFPLGYTLALTNFIVPEMGAAGFWVGLIIGLSLSALLQSLRVYLTLNNYKLH